MKHIFLLAVILAGLSSVNIRAEDGYDLWLRYTPLSDPVRYEAAEAVLGKIVVSGDGPAMDAIREELVRASLGMLGKEPELERSNSGNENTGAGPGLVIGTPGTCRFSNPAGIASALEGLGEEGYFIGYRPGTDGGPLVIAARQPVGLLYGMFHLLRDLQAWGEPRDLPVRSAPAFTHRLLNHWDNLDRTVERGYAGFSIWDWHRLPEYIHPRYRDYARANASIGINGSVVTNVNANSLVLSRSYIRKAAALAEVFRPYGITLYLTARFSAPMELDGLETADPLDPRVSRWWKSKAEEIYREIPDFGGFLVKANSEGQPGPQDYGRTHAEGANMLADAVGPHGGIVMWRAFVYSADIKEDRARQAYSEFVPLDGKFRENVVIQVKNGPIDFQPREPFHPLFGSMPETPLALELQITQEYLGQATHLVYLAPLFSEVLGADTYKPGPGSTVARVVDGTLDGHSRSVLAGVSNVGTDRNWTGHLFGQANWYAFGRLGWDPELDPEALAEEWIRLTFGSGSDLTGTLREVMKVSREAVVNYMTPLGLHHIMAEGHHYGPGPWVSQGRPDWTSVYYHRADSTGIGFDRTESGSNALEQYAPEIRDRWSDPETIPEGFLLWFHHLPWDYLMPSGNTLWAELCIHYDRGVDQVRWMKQQWEGLEEDVDRERFTAVRSLLAIQVKEAEWWRNACLLYFRQFSGMPFPESVDPPRGDLEELIHRAYPYAPGIRPRW